MTGMLAFWFAPSRPGLRAPASLTLSGNHRTLSAFHHLASGARPFSAIRHFAGAAPLRTAWPGGRSHGAPHRGLPVACLGSKAFPLTRHLFGPHPFWEAGRGGQPFLRGSEAIPPRSPVRLLPSRFACRLSGSVSSCPCPLACTHVAIARQEGRVTRRNRHASSVHGMFIPIPNRGAGYDLGGAFLAEGSIGLRVLSANRGGFPRVARRPVFPLMSISSWLR